MIRTGSEMRWRKWLEDIASCKPSVCLYYPASIHKVGPHNLSPIVKFKLINTPVPVKYTTYTYIIIIAHHSVSRHVSIKHLNRKKLSSTLILVRVRVRVG